MTYIKNVITFILLFFILFAINPFSIAIDEVKIDNKASIKANTLITNEVIQSNQIQTSQSTDSIATNAGQRTKGDLTDILDSVTLQDMDGNNVESINPNNKYTLTLDFKEDINSQMELNDDGTITYQLPENFKIEGVVVDALLYNKNGIKVGTYSINSDGTITVKFDKVDEHGNPMDKYFPENCSDADFKISLTGKFNVNNITDDKFVQDFGNGKKLEFPIDKEFFIDIEKTNEWSTNDYHNYTKGYIHESHEVYYSVKVSPKTDVKNLYVEDILDKKLEFQGERLNKDNPWRALTIYYTFPDGTKKQTNISLYQYPDTIFFKENVLTDLSDEVLNKETLKKYLEFEKQSDGTTRIIFHLFGPDGSDKIPANTEITIDYYTTLNELAEEEIKNAQSNYYDFFANNKATVKGTDVKSEKELSDSAEITTELKATVLQKYGETVTIETDKGAMTVVKWVIDIGDYATSLKGTKIIDKSITQGMKVLPNNFIFNLIKGNNGSAPDKSVTFDELESTDPLTYTVEDDWRACHIEFYALYDFQTSGDAPVSELVENKVSIDGGDLGHKEATANATVGSDIPISTKTMEPFKDGDTELKFKVHHSIPKSFFEIPDNNSWSAMDHMECLWGETIFYKGKQIDVQYKVNWYDFKDYFAKNTKIYISDESNNTFKRKEITYANTWEEYNKEKDKFRINMAEEKKNGSWMSYLFSEFSEEIPDMLGMDIEYTVPLSIDVDVFNSSTGELLFTGKLEDYTGITFANEANIEYYNSDYSVYKWFPAGIVNFSLPSKLKKSVDFDYNDEGKIVSNIAKFSIIINSSAENLDLESENLILKDKLSPNLLLLEETIELYEYNTKTGNYDIKIKNLDYTYTQTSDSEPNTFKITIPDEKNLKLTYEARIKKTTEENSPPVQNLAELEGIPNSKSKTEFVFEILDNSAYVGGSTDGVNIRLIKYGKPRLNSNKKLLPDVVFNLYSVPDEGEKKLLTSLTTDESGKVELTGLNIGKYELEEKKVTKGYNLLNKPITIEIKNDKTVKVSENRFVKYSINEENLNVIEITNLESLELPLTGGNGSIIYIVIGIILVLYIIKLDRSKVRRKVNRKNFEITDILKIPVVLVSIIYLETGRIICKTLRGIKESNKRKKGRRQKPRISKNE